MPYMFQFPPQSENRLRGRECQRRNHNRIHPLEHNGLFYHVLGGLISPIDGIGPSDVEIDSLIARVEEEKIEEVILALVPLQWKETPQTITFSAAWNQAL